ncbi:hypothetical protein GGI24_004332 [Coemansia furcata]|nr:hypothetical protein GGI24_004332 [Coemansia furcata]
MGAVESLPSMSYHDRLFGDRQHASGNKPTRSATICLSSCTSGATADDPLTGEKGQIRQSSTARGLFRASLRRYSYRGPRSHGKEGVRDDSLMGSNRMVSAEDIRMGDSYTRSVDGVPQLSASMPHLPTHVESLRAAAKGGMVDGLAKEFAPSNNAPPPLVGAQGPVVSGMAEFRQRLARRLSRSSSSGRHSRRRSPIAAAPLGKRPVSADTTIDGGKRAVTVDADSQPPASVRDAHCEAMLARGLGLLHIGDTGERLDIPFVGGSGDDVTEEDDSEGDSLQLLPEPGDCLADLRLFDALSDSSADGGQGVEEALSASSSMTSLSSSSSVTLSDEPTECRAGQRGPLEYSGAEVLDYEDFMYLSACENRRRCRLRTSMEEDAGVRGDFDDDARRWWPRCVLPAQNMQYMPKLSAIFSDEPTGKQRSSATPLPMAPRVLLRARSEGALSSSVPAECARRVDFWDVLGRCPMRPTSSLALASLKDMAHGQRGRRRSDQENQSPDQPGLADSASDSDDDDQSLPACGMLLGLATAKQQQRGNAQPLRGVSSSAVGGNKHRTKRVLSEPMQYILYNSYLRYYGRPGESL